MCICLHVKYPLFLRDFNKTCIFSTNLKNAQVSNLIKIRPVGAQLFHADGQTDKQDEANSHDLRLREGT
jgi:hypothetical protein